MKHQPKALTPKLRFPEFRESWRAKAVGELLEERPRPIELQPDKEYALVTVKRRYGGVVRRETLKGKEILVKSQFLVEPNDFLISKRQIVHNACGVVPAELDQSIVSNEYSVLTARNGCEMEFFNYFSQQPCVSRSFMHSSVGIVIEKMLFQLNVWLELRFPFPSPAEQRKIGACLTSLDELLAAEGRKLEVLRAHRKGLMQHLFPRAGESRPCLRFPEFRDGPEWQTKKIGDVFDTATGGTPERTVKAYWDGGIPWVTTSLVDFNVILRTDETISTEGLENSAAKIFPKGTILMALYGQGKTRGKVAMLGIEATTNQACAAILPSGEVDQTFAFLNLAARYDEIRAISNAGGQENLSQGLLRELPFCYPNEPVEQQRIATCLSSLDALIAASSRRLDCLRAHKKGLMQQLFPSTEE